MNSIELMINIVYRRKGFTNILRTTVVHYGCGYLRKLNFHLLEQRVCNTSYVYYKRLRESVLYRSFANGHFRLHIPNYFEILHRLYGREWG